MAKRLGALIGFGNIAEKGHWPAYAKALASDPTPVEIVAVMDPSPERRAAAEALKPGVRTYASVEDLFRTEQFDFVDICTPPAAHAALALEALRRGAHVLCEKPLVLSAEDYVALNREAVARDRTVFPVHNWAYA